MTNIALRERVALAISELERLIRESKSLKEKYDHEINELKKRIKK